MTREEFIAHLQLMQGKIQRSGWSKDNVDLYALLMELVTVLIRHEMTPVEFETAGFRTDKCA